MRRYHVFYGSEHGKRPIREALKPRKVAIRPFLAEVLGLSVKQAGMLFAPSGYAPIVVRRYLAKYGYKTKGKRDKKRTKPEGNLD